MHHHHTLVRSPDSRYRRPAGQIAPKVKALDPLDEATLEEALSWTRVGHQKLHDASRLFAESISSGQLSISESARAELVAAINAAARALASL